MQVVKQGTSLPIRQLSLAEKRNKRRRGLLLPDYVRAIIVGPSGCGKTNVIRNLLTSDDGLVFHNVYVTQQAYAMLKNILEPIPNVKYFPSEEGILSANEVRPNSIVIFDYLPHQKESLSNLQSYFSVGRHRNLDCFYL